MVYYFNCHTVFGHAINGCLVPCKSGMLMKYELPVAGFTNRTKYERIIVEDVSSAVDYLLDVLHCDNIMLNKRVCDNIKLNF